MQFLDTAITVAEIAFAASILTPVLLTALWVLVGDRKPAITPVASVSPVVPELDEDLEPEVIVEAIARHIPAQAAAIAPVATLSIPLPVLTSATDFDDTVVLNYEGMSSAELRKHCTRAGIQWRNAHGTSRHLRKAEMIAALDG